MAQLVKFRGEIEGTKVEYFSSFELTQAIYEHHSFRMTIPAEAIDGKSTILNSSKNLVGSTVRVTVNPWEEEEVKLKFVGIITQVETVRDGGHDGDLVISGYSPTIVLDNGPHCKAWENTSIKKIFDHVLTHFPSNLLKPNFSPSSKTELPYVVQYGESAWQFICRLGATFGEWVYFDGESLKVGYPKGDVQKLEFGNNLSSFGMALQIRPPSFQLVGFDYKQRQKYSSTPGDVSDKAGFNDLGKTAYKKSQALYGVQAKDWQGLHIESQAELDDQAKARAFTQASNMVKFQGTSDHPALTPGTRIHISGNNFHTGRSEIFGDFIVISTRHYFDADGNFTNDFVAIPATLNMPPVELHEPTRCEIQSGLVTDNNDPNKMGRIRVRLHWMTDNEKTPWVRVASPHAGKEKGMYWIPEVGDEVIVGFENGSPDHPFIIGSLWNGTDTNSFGNDANDVKALMTRSGNLISMNDKEGSVVVADAKGNQVLFDGKGNIKATASESITLTSGEASITLKKDGTIEIKGKDVKITATNDFQVKASNDVNVQASNNLTEKAGNQVEIEGTQTTVKGSAKVEVNASGQVNIGASGQVAVKGAVIMLN